jgi:hypothetical protein
MFQENRGRAVPDRSVELSREDTGWVITARWHSDVGPAGINGPDEVVIRVADDAAPEVRERGITSAVLHPMGRQVDDMVAEFHVLPSVGAYQVMVRRYIEGRLAELARERGAEADGFESDLLAVFVDLAGRGHADPLGSLATATGRSQESLNSLLDVARKRNRHYRRSE